MQPLSPWYGGACLCCATCPLHLLVYPWHRVYTPHLSLPSPSLSFPPPLLSITGTFGAQDAMTRCNQCSPGTYADQPGSVACSPCPAGLLAGMFGQAVCCAPLDLCEALADGGYPTPYNPVSADCSNRMNLKVGTPCRAANYSACQQPVTCTGASASCDVTAEVQSTVDTSNLVFQPQNGYYVSSVGVRCTHYVRASVASCAAFAHEQKRVPLLLFSCRCPMHSDPTPCYVLV